MHLAITAMLALIMATAMEATGTVVMEATMVAMDMADTDMVDMDTHMEGIMVTMAL